MGKIGNMLNKILGNVVFQWCSEFDIFLSDFKSILLFFGIFSMTSLIRVSSLKLLEGRAV